MTIVIAVLAALLVLGVTEICCIGVRWSESRFGFSSTGREEKRR